MVLDKSERYLQLCIGLLLLDICFQLPTSFSCSPDKNRPPSHLPSPWSLRVCPWRHRNNVESMYSAWNEAEDGQDDIEPELAATT